MAGEEIFVWYGLGWICGVKPVNIPQKYAIILQLVNDHYRNGYQRLQPCCLVKSVVMTNHFKMASSSSSNLAIDKISNDANLPN